MQTGHLLGDGIAPEAFLALGCAFIIPAMLVVVIEWLALKLTCGRPRRALAASFLANLASGLVGIALMVFFFMQWRWIPNELDRYYSADKIFSLVRYATYFLLSLGVEYVVVRWVIRPQNGVKRLGMGVLVGNTITYAMICPLLYWVTSPRQDLTDLRSDSAWCADSTTTILYLDRASGYLMKTDPQRAHTETVVARHVTDYQIRPDLHSGLFLDGTTLYQFQGEKVTKIAVLDSSDSDVPLISQVAMSPSEKWVAYVTPIKTKNDSGAEVDTGWRLTIFNTVTAQGCPITTSLEDVPDAPALVWTQREAVFLAASRSGTQIQQLTLDPDKAVVVETTYKQSALAEKTYGTFGTFNGPHDFLTVATDESPQWSAAVNHFICQSLLLRQGEEPGGPGKLELDVWTDFLGPADRWDFVDVAMIRGSSLCVLEDDAAPMLYLIDADARRLGRLVPGRKMVLLTDKYEAEKCLKVE